MPLGSLQTPVGSDFIKNFPGQNAVTCDAIDNYAGPCLTTHPIQTYIPQWTATTTSPTLGTGAKALGYYYRIFDQCYVWGEDCLGTAGAARGSGIYEISLPFKAKTITGASNVSGVVGNAQAFDISDVTQRLTMLTVLAPSPNKVRFYIPGSTAAASRFCTETSPWLFNAGDGIMWSARYQIDPT